MVPVMSGLGFLAGVIARKPRHFRFGFGILLLRARGSNFQL